MKIDKPSDEDKEYFADVFGQYPGLEIKAMFGNLAAFATANQQMCAGLFGANVGLRLTEADREELRAIPGTGPFGPEGRPMKEYVVIPHAWRHDDSSEIDYWIHRAIAHTESLAPKKPKAKKAKAKQAKAKKA